MCKRRIDIAGGDKFNMLHLKTTYRKTKLRKVRSYFSVLMMAIVTLGAFLAAPHASADDPEVSAVVWRLNQHDGPTMAKEYRDLLARIGNAVSHPIVNGIGAIPENTATNARVDIEVLTSEGNAVTFHMLRRNMYIQAFTLSGTTYITSDAFGRGLISGAGLPFSSDYASLGAHNMGNISDPTLFTVGGASLDTLLCNLFHAVENTQNFNRSAARALYAAAILFSEATRFSPSLGRNIAQAIENGHPYNLTNADSEMIRNWGQLSNWGRAQLQSPNQPPFQLPPHVRANREGRPDGHGVDKVKNMTTLAWLLGVLAIAKVSG